MGNVPIVWEVLTTLRPSFFFVVLGKLVKINHLFLHMAGNDAAFTVFGRNDGPSGSSLA